MLENYIIDDGPVYDVFSKKHREIPAGGGLTKLQLGSYDTIPGYDDILELQKIPWSIGDCSVDDCSVSEIIIGPVICQIINLLDVIDECWRTLIPGGLLLITAPFARSDDFTRNPHNVVPIDENAMGIFCAPWCKRYNLLMPTNCDFDPLIIEFEYIGDWKY